MRDTLNTRLNPEFATQEGVLEVISNSKKRSKENTGVIVDAGGHLRSKNEKKAKSFNTFLPQYLIVMTDLGLPGTQSSKDYDWGSCDFPSVVTKMVREHLHCS